jgi:ABC-type sugar transport system ATPase subunit
MGIRPEHLAHGSGGEITLQGVTVLVEPMGPANLVSVKVGENELKLLLSGLPSVGASLDVSLSARDAIFFDAQSGRRLKLSSKQ